MTRQTKPKTRKAQGEETRAILLATAARLFATHGFHGVSMRTLAAEAKVNLATVGYHFGGKAGLYEAVMQNFIDVLEHIFPMPEEINRRMEAAGDDPYRRADVVSWYVETMVRGTLGKEDHIWCAFLISREMAQPTDLYPKLETDFFQPVFDSMTALTSGTIQGDDSFVDQVIAAHCIIGMVVKMMEGFPLISKRLGWEYYDTDNINSITNVLVKRIRGFLGLPMESEQ